VFERVARPVAGAAGDGVAPRVAHGSIRLSISRLTTDEEIAYASEAIPACIARLRRSGGAH
jgi:cysteine sulfinate desulfinase/cysteine desulfurase-like protein